MTQIIPAILPVDYAEIEEKVALVKSLTKKIQIDICDGEFVPNTTWPYTTAGSPEKDEFFDRLIHEEIGLPEWEKIDFEFDLMVSGEEFARTATDWISVGASRLILHGDARFKKEVVNDLLGKIELSIALHMDEEISVLEDFTSMIEAGSIRGVELMGIDNVGFQGQAFDDKVINKIILIKQKYPDLEITIDGGVSGENLEMLKKAGADRLVVGSAIFDAENPVEELKNLLAIS